MNLEQLMQYSPNTDIFALLGWLVFAHILLDFALQGDFMAKSKDFIRPTHGVSPTLMLAMHSFTHAFAVYIITGSFLLFAIEWVLHALIDYMKVHRWLSFNFDQGLHITVKVLFVIYLGLL